MAEVESSSSSVPTDVSAPSDMRAPTQGDLRGRIVGIIDSRARTDRRMSRLWAATPIFILWLVVSNFVMYAVIIWDFGSHWPDDRLRDLLSASYVACVPVFGVLFGAMIYKSLRRTTQHMSREDSLRAAVMAFLRNASSTSGKEPQVMDGLLSLSAFDGQAVVYEKRHNPVLWGIGIPALFLAYPAFLLLVLFVQRSDVNIELVLMGSLVSSLLGLVFLVASAYILNSLMRTTYTHDVRWRGFTASTMVVLHTLGMVDTGEWRHQAAEDRPMILFVVITLVTLGFFLFAWFYVLVEDMNKHLEEQHRFEDMLRKVLTSTATA